MSSNIKKASFIATEIIPQRHNSGFFFLSDAGFILTCQRSLFMKCWRDKNVLISEDEAFKYLVAIDAQCITMKD